jgi:hypothetical protein
MNYGSFNTPGVYSSVTSQSNPPKGLTFTIKKYVDEATVSIDKNMLERIKSIDIKEMRENSGNLEYTLDGQTWNAVQGSQNNGKNNVVYLGNFNGSNNEAKIQSAIDYAVSNNIKTVLLEDVAYIISAGIILKENIKLIGGYGSSFTVYGSNYKVLDFKKNSSLEGLKIHIDDENFIGSVLHFDGVNKYYNSWNRTAVRDVAIIDWNDYRKCIGMKLFADGNGDEISFLEFDSIKLTNLNVGISVEVIKPPTGTSYVNGNKFNNITLEGCNEMISISSDITVPNEFSGNIFSNLQIQPSYATQKLITINGGYNSFNGMIWDLHLIPHSNNVIFLSNSSEYTKFDFQNMPYDRVSDLGNSNNLGRRIVLESRTSDPTNTVIGQMWFRSDL